MYDELLKMLRTCAERDSCIGWREACPYLGTGVCDNKAEKAADAIEALICEVATEHNARLDAEDRLNWIPVTERLPKEEKCEYWCYTDVGVMCECRWTNNRYGLGTSDEWGWNIMDVPQYQKVTHWMPLPKPPKEE